MSVNLTYICGSRKGGETDFPLINVKKGCQMSKVTLQ